MTPVELLLPTVFVIAVAVGGYIFIRSRPLPEWVSKPKPLPEPLQPPKDASSAINGEAVTNRIIPVQLPAASAISFGVLVGGVFLGNILAAIAISVVYYVCTH